MSHWLDKIGAAGYDWDKKPNYKIPGTVKKAVAPPAKKAPAANTNTLKYVYDQALFVQGLLRAEGIREPALSYAVFQCYFETGAFTNNGYLKLHNASGIMFNGQRNAKRGPNGYADFLTWKDWAYAMAHELRKKAAPVKAANLEDYVKRLKENRYFESDPQLYYYGLKRARLVLKIIPAEMRAGDDGTGQWQNPQDMDIPGSQIYKNTPGSADYKKEETGLKPWHWGLIFLGGAIVLKKLAD
jgi:hypothetical protein